MFGLKRLALTPCVDVLNGDLNESITLLLLFSGPDRSAGYFTVF